MFVRVGGFRAEFVDLVAGTLAQFVGRHTVWSLLLGCDSPRLVGEESAELPKIANGSQREPTAKPQVTRHVARVAAGHATAGTSLTRKGSGVQIAYRPPQET